MSGASSWEPGKVGGAPTGKWADIYAPIPDPPWCPLGNLASHDVMTCTLPACKEWAAGQRKRDREDAYFREAERVAEEAVDQWRNEREGQS